MRLLLLSGRGAALSLAVALTSCGGAGNAPSAFDANATNPGVPVAGKATRVVPATFTFKIPRRSANAAALRRQPQYLPASTLSLEIQLVTVDGSAPSPVPSPTIVNVSGCTATSGGYTCTLTTALPVGSDVVLVKSFDAIGAGGNLLSQQNGTFAVVAGNANAFTMTLDATPGAIALSTTGTACSGSPLTCSVTLAGALGVTATVVDAHGTALANNAVAGSPVVSAVSSNSAIATVTANQAPYGVSVTPVANGTATIAVTASPATGTSGLSATTVNFTITVAPQPALNAPAGIAFDGAGNLYVVNRGTNSVKIFNTAGAASSIAGGTIATTPGPWGTAVDGAGNIYVTSTTGNSVQIFTNTGAVSPIAGGTITGLSSPYGVAVDGAGNIYVANFSAHNVKIFTSTGAVSPIAGGTITTGLTFPCGVAVDGAGNIYVSDCSAYAIKIFTNSTTPGGAPSTTIGVGTTGTIPSSAGVSDPISVAVDGAGKIYVGNYGGSLMNVNVFTSTGVLTNTITSGVQNPGGVAVVAGKLYVGNVSGNTVTVYDASTGALLNTIH